MPTCHDTMLSVLFGGDLLTVSQVKMEGRVADGIALYEKALSHNPRYGVHGGLNVCTGVFSLSPIRHDIPN